MQNEYDVYGFDKKDLSYKYMGAKVKFKLLGQIVFGEVSGVETSQKLLTVDLLDGTKTLCTSVRGHFRNFKIV